MTNILPNSRSIYEAAGRQGPDLMFKVSLNARRGSIELRTAHPVPGGGNSLVTLTLSLKDFGTVIDKMIKVDRKAMLDALSAVHSAVASDLEAPESSQPVRVPKAKIPVPKIKNRLRP